MSKDYVSDKETYLRLAEDLVWLRDQWPTRAKPFSDSELRRASPTLRRLLVDDAIGNAWRKLELGNQPIIVGPDAVALLKREGYQLRHIVKLIAGGGSWGGVQVMLHGAIKVHNDSTGIGPDSDEGFAVALRSTARKAYAGDETSSNDDLLLKEWTLSEYMKGASGIVLGNVISRRELVQLHANYLDGAHSISGAKSNKLLNYERCLELKKVFIKDVEGKEIDGIFFELLSIGQAIGASPDIHRLIENIRTRFS